VVPNMNKKLLKISNAIEELRLPRRGIQLRAQVEALLIALDSIVFKGLCYALRWLIRGLRVLIRGLTAPQLLGLLLLALLLIMVAHGL
jgi:hypothetical protein